tara:strand:+ start:15593 stop:16630 length:1038 start_codon:yes stop_codon:yes gene_type:complete
MSEEFKHLPYCKTCDIFSDDCGHEIVTFDQWSENKTTGEKFVCAHGYKIRWYRGSLNEMGNTGKYERRGRCLECGAQILATYSIEFAKYQKPDGDGGYVTDSVERKDITAPQPIEESNTYLNWMEDVTSLYNDDEESSSTDPYERFSGHMFTGFRDGDDTLKCVNCDQNYIRDDGMTGASVNKFFCRSCIEQSCERAGIYVGDPHITNNHYVLCDFFEKFKTLHWFESILTCDREFQESAERMYGIGADYLHTLTSAGCGFDNDDNYMHCMHCDIPLVQVTSRFIIKIMNALNHTDVEYKGWDIIDNIQICENCFDNHNYNHEGNTLSPDAIYSDNEPILTRYEV